MNLPWVVLILGCLIGGFASSAGAAWVAKPNIVFLLADDLGYGDVRCNNPDGKIATPHLDRLAATGMRFTDAHTTSSVCTPSRYSLLTGRYNWRSRLQDGVLGGLSPPLIESGRLTVPGLLQRQGYRTAVIGKWHLGLDWVDLKEKPAPVQNNVETTNVGWSVDFGQPVANSPITAGFDYFFGIAASLDMAPYTFIENNRVTVIPTTNMSFAMTAGKGRGRTRLGPGAPEFEAEQVLPTLTRKSVDYIAAQAAEAKAGKPFFLYVPFASPHTPILPTQKFRGKSGISPYADFVMETDWAVGEILAALDQHGLAESTLVFFTSDNGCAPAADIPELRAAGHEPNGPWRGAKADIWDGGHRVPFLARWPGRVRAGTTNDQLVSLVDLMATVSEMLGAKLPDNAGEDSVSILPALEGRAAKPLREALVHHSINGKFAIRQGQWKLEFCPGSGGWGTPRDSEALSEDMPGIQLYDMAADPKETKNVQAEHPEVVTRLTKLLEKYAADGRSTPGKPQTNDAQIDLWKKPRR